MENVTMILPREVRQRLKEIAEIEPHVSKGDSMKRSIALDEYVQKIKREYPQCFKGE